MLIYLCANGDSNWKSNSLWVSLFTFQGVDFSRPWFGLLAETCFLQTRKMQPCVSSQSLATWSQAWAVKWQPTQSPRLNLLRGHYPAAQSQPGFVGVQEKCSVLSPVLWYNAEGSQCIAGFYGSKKILCGKSVVSNDLSNVYWPLGFTSCSFLSDLSAVILSGCKRCTRRAAEVQMEVSRDLSQEKSTLRAIQYSTLIYALEN